MTDLLPDDDHLEWYSLRELAKNPPVRNRIKRAGPVPPPPSSPLTWVALLAYEPELQKIYTECCNVRDEGGPSFCANAVWYRTLKPQLQAVVGADGRIDDPVLLSWEAYDLARQHCYEVLPPCRNCGCLSPEGFGMDPADFYARADGGTR